MQKNILISAYLIYPDSTGGAGKVAYEQALHLKDKGFNVYVLTLNKKQLAQHENINGLFYNRINPSYSFLGDSINIHLKYPYYLKKILKENNINYILVHYPHEAYVIQKILKNSPDLQNIKLFYIFHAPSYKEINLEGLSNSLKNLLKKPFALWTKHCERKALENSNEIIVMSDFMKNELLKQHSHIPSHKIHILSHGIKINNKVLNNDEKKQIRKKINIDNNKEIYITVRRLTKRMGLDNLIKSIKLLSKKSSKNFTLYIIGDGPEKDNLIKLRDSLGLKNFIQFTGYIDDEKLKYFYQSCDAFVLPTAQLEGLGISTLEALSYGTIVLGTKVGATYNILNKIDNRLIIKSSSPEDIAETLLLFQQFSSNEKKLIAEKGQKYLQTFHNWKTIEEKLINILEK